MKLLLILLTLVLANPVFAIEWVNLVTPLGKSVYLDVDSIKVYKDNYFYNIKLQKQGAKGNNDVVLTIQSGVKHPYSAKINSYKELDYNALNGDYENITAKFTHNLELVTFNSVTYTCYKKVKELKPVNKNPNVTFN